MRPRVSIHFFFLTFGCLYGGYLGGTDISGSSNSHCSDRSLDTEFSIEITSSTTLVYPEQIIH